MRTRIVVALGAAAFALTACGRTAPPTPAPPPSASAPPPSASSVAPPPKPPKPPETQPQPAAWTVGATPLPLRPDGFGEVLPTPAVLADRSLPTRDVLPPPASGTYESSIGPVPPDVLAHSTWRPGCPVPPEDLRYLTMSFHGFDGRPHTGEMLVHADVAADVVRVFERLFTARFPLEEMRVVAAVELDFAPTGDGNNTSAFVCRSARGQTRWSAHAYGAFESIGWTWGGRWSTPLDLMHLSATGD